MTDGQQPEKQKRQARESKKPAEPSAAVLIKAVNHPIRRQILRTFGDGKPRSAKDITEDVRVSLGAISYHLNVLKKWGVVTPLKSELRRGTLKRICAPNLKGVDPYVTSILLATEEQDDEAVPRRTTSSANGSATKRLA